LHNLFKPVQPEWNRKLSNIVSRECTSHFRSSISFVYQFEFRSTVEQEILLPSIPDGCLDLIFNLNGDLNDCYLIPSPKARKNLTFKTNNLYFGIRLLPLQSVFSFDLTVGEINHHTYLSLFDTNAELIQLYEKLMHLQTIDQRLQAVEAYLSQSTTTCITHSTIMSCCLDLALTAKGNLHVKELESLTCYSERYLRKLFQQEIGISPKSFLETIYFQFTLHEMLRGNFNVENHLSTNDLYDVSHFYKKFKKLTNMTPIKYQKLII